MLAVDQFVTAKYLDYEGWLEARKTGITATTIAKAMTSSGFTEVVDGWGVDNVTPPNPYMTFGNDQEPQLALWAKSHFGTMPNDWLIRHESNPVALATPDGLSLDHETILEVKTTGKDWGDVTKIPIQYKRQIQWQLYVTGASRCVFVWLLRAESNGVMVPAWIDPKYGFIDRDEKLINNMVETAKELWEVLDYEREG